MVYFSKDHLGGLILGEGALALPFDADFPVLTQSAN